MTPLGLPTLLAPALDGICVVEFAVLDFVNRNVRLQQQGVGGQVSPRPRAGVHVLALPTV
jgi:hypothetical protein